jgi:hypothetical protein
MLVPWAVLALAAGVKFWRLTRLFRRQLTGTTNPSAGNAPAGSSSASSTTASSERFREQLERIWARQQR